MALEEDRLKTPRLLIGLFSSHCPCRTALHPTSSMRAMQSRRLRLMMSSADSWEPPSLVSFRLACAAPPASLPATAACMHLTQQSINIVANLVADLPSVPCQEILPGSMGLMLSPVMQDTQDKPDLQWPAGSVGDHEVGSEAGVPTTAPAGEKQPSTVGSSMGRLTSIICISCGCEAASCGEGCRQRSSLFRLLLSISA